MRAVDANDAKKSSQKIAKVVRELRLSNNLSRKTLSMKSGVSDASIKRFELEGEISFSSLLKLVSALNCLSNFESIFLMQDIGWNSSAAKTNRVRGRK